MNSFLLNALNDERAARGVAPLALDASLSKRAQDWSAHMGTKGVISHSSSGIPAGFNAFGENVLKAGDSTTAAGVHNLWLASSGHRKHMLQPGFDRVGIGAVCVNGSIYATEAFGHSESAGEPDLAGKIPDATAQSPTSGGPTC